MLEAKSQRFDGSKTDPGMSRPPRTLLPRTQTLLPWTQALRHWAHALRHRAQTLRHRAHALRLWNREARFDWLGTDK